MVVTGYFHQSRFILRVENCTTQCRLGNCTKQILDSGLRGTLFKAEKSLGSAAKFMITIHKCCSDFLVYLLNDLTYVTIICSIIINSI